MGLNRGVGMLGCVGSDGEICRSARNPTRQATVSKALCQLNIFAARPLLHEGTAFEALSCFVRWSVGRATRQFSDLR